MVVLRNPLLPVTSYFLNKIFDSRFVNKSATPTYNGELGLYFFKLYEQSTAYNST